LSFPITVRGDRRKNPRVVRFDHWGAAKVRAPTWRDLNAPLSGLPGSAGGANWRADRIHLFLLTALCVPVQ